MYKHVNCLINFAFLTRWAFVSQSVVTATDFPVVYTGDVVMNEINLRGRSLPVFFSLFVAYRRCSLHRRR